jgi:hypothetical protein
VEKIATEGQQSVELFGLVGLCVMVFAHLVWDPTVTALGVAEFGITEEDNNVVRQLWRIHPLVWLATKGFTVGGMTIVVWRIGAHRHLVSACLLYLIAVLGFVGPLGWIELLAYN